MKQSRNLTRSAKEIEALYTQILEGVEAKPFENEKNVSAEALEPNDSGPENVEGIEAPAELEKPVKENSHHDEDGDGDTDSDDYLAKKDKAIKKAMGKEEESDDHEKKQSNENTEKTNISNINTNMSDKNIFDKLYSTIMEADDELGDALDMPFGGGEEMDDMNDEAGDDVTFTLPRDVAEKLHDVLMAQLEQGGEDELEDMEEEQDGGFEEENPFPEAVEAEHTNDGMHPGHDPSGLTGHGNKVPGTASKVTSGGASGDTSGQEDGGKPKPMADTVAKMTSKSNKVDGAIKGGNQDLLT